MRLATVLAAASAMMLGGCASKVTREVERLDIDEAATAVQAVSYRSGSIRLAIQDGRWMTLEACGAGGAQRLCGTIQVGPGRKLHMPTPRVILQDPVTGQREDLAIEQLSFETRCTLVPARIDVPYSVRLQDNTCPSDADDLGSVEGPVRMELVDQRVDARTTRVVKRFTFAAELPFRGASSGSGGSDDPARNSRQYRFASVAAKHFRIGQTLVLTLPTIDLDGQPQILPRLQLHQQTETSYQFRELM
ncbi:hypothetical protein [Herbaspirillum sp. UBA812]|uniref:hypothetical protein n=1 Tax=Herbaspirillum sp. UBA812 TaxID=1946590 RepID=UPI00257C55CE|nr:hypothetical protein [Herbaspirillum sp. UBA812]